jgi:hypothetical protein
VATTWIKALHVNKGKTIAQTLADRTDYADNPEKTKKGELVTGYCCDPPVADEQFLLAKKEYEHITGRDQGEHNVLAYHIRQSFKPGEVSPEEANRVGYELAERFFKGKHSFIVATHIDKLHIHNHIIVNSTTIDCTYKFKDFKRSGRAVRRLSDLICAEHGLSVIENPKPSRGSYADWLDEKPPSWSEQIKRKVDEILPACATFDAFIAAIRGTGCIVRDDKKHISITLPGQVRAIRLNTLGGEYTEAAIRERLAQYAADRKRNPRGTGTGGATAEASRPAYQPPVGRVGLLIDIQAKIREGKGAAYEQWAKVFNLKQAAKTLIFLQENGIDSYEDLKKKASAASGGFSALTKKIRDVEIRMNEITELQKYIGQYGKTREVYAAYKKSGWSGKFYDAHTADIILHRAAKKYFDGLGMKKLPSITSLKQEWATLNAEKRNLYAGYREQKENAQTLTAALGNANHILGIAPNAQNRDASRDAKRRTSQEI